MPRSSHAAVMSWAMVGSSDLSACPQSTSIGICAGTRLSSPAASVCVCVCVLGTFHCRHRTCGT